MIHPTCINSTSCDKPDVFPDIENRENVRNVSSAGPDYRDFRQLARFSLPDRCKEETEEIMQKLLSRLVCCVSAATLIGFAFLYVYANGIVFMGADPCFPAGVGRAQCWG